MNKPTLLPKRPNAPAFKKLYDALVEGMLPAHWVLILEGALDRRTLDSTLRKYVPDAPRTEQMERTELVGRATGALLHNREAAFSLFRSLDRSCQKQRSNVSEMQDGSLRSHVMQYRALDFRRERSRMVWALLRDGRDEATETARFMLGDAFHMSDVHQQLASSDDESNEQGENKNAKVILAKKELLRVEAVLSENQKTLQHEQAARADDEKERSKLIVRLGQREHTIKGLDKELRDLKEHNQELQHQNDELNARVSTADEEHLQELASQRDQLKAKVHSLERKIDYADGLLPLQDENAALHGQVAQLEERLKATHQNQTSLLGQITARERAARERVTSLKDALKQARKLTSATPEQHDSKVVLERVGLFVDVANIGASAKRIHGKNFDFISMMKTLLDDRKQVIAVAFVVEAETQKGMSGFSKELRSAGYDVRIKRPRTRTDGTRKADWDMGIAMEVIEARNRIDTVILATGDGDFLPLIVKVKKWGKRVEVASFIECTDRSLLGVTDNYADLTSQFLLERSPG